MGNVVELGEACACGLWVPYLGGDGVVTCDCGRLFVPSRAPEPSPEPRGHSLLRSLFHDGDVRDSGPDETRMRDLETQRWFHTLPLAKQPGGWRCFVPDYSLPLHAETLAFERLLGRGRIEFHEFMPAHFRIRPKR